MTEWANYMSYMMWAGYSSRGGLTLNPYGPGELFVGGSSSGSGAKSCREFVRRFYWNRDLWFNYQPILTKQYCWYKADDWAC